MSPHALQTLALLAATTGAGILMTLSGLGKNMLVRRNHKRRCPSCGCLIRGRVCDRH